MARHAQNGHTVAFVCSGCKAGECDKCLDVARANLVAGGFISGATRLCECRRKSHGK